MSVTSFVEYQQQFHQAIEDEIKSLRKLGGKNITIIDGRHLGKRSGNHLYSFTADTEIRFPEDTPVDLVHQKQQYSGTLLSIDGFDLLIAIEKNIGERVLSAKMNTNPWFLLQELQKRLEAATTHPTANRELALNLLSKSVTSSPTNSTKFEDLSSFIETQIQKSLNYNCYQSEAVTHVLQHPVSFVWGPPGTGKTTTLGLAIASLVHSGESVLVLAHSNVAVDNAVKSFAKYLCKSSYYREGLILRFGIAIPGTYDDYPLINIRGIAKRENPSLIEEIEKLERERKQLTQESRDSGLTKQQKSLLEERIVQIRGELKPLREELRRKEDELVRKAMVVGCTLSKAVIAREIYERQFDAVIIDEASMAYIPHSVYAATLARRRIAIFGDFRQLGPISQAETDKAQTWLQRDIFEEAGIIDCVDRNRKNERMVLLQIQYRMHPSISAIPNRLFYKNQLKDAEGVQSQTQPIVDAQPNPGRSLIFYDLSFGYAFCFRDWESDSRFNLISALVAADIAYKSKQAGIESIGIITPYKAQSRLIHRIMKEIQLEKTVKVSTVHRFQGSEQHLIIFDAVDGSPQKRVGKLLRGGMQSTAARLANVAISRAQGKFIGLLSDAYFRQKLDVSDVFYQFNEQLHRNSQVLPLFFNKNSLHGSGRNSSTWQFAIPDITTYSNFAEARKSIQIDIVKAQDIIAIDWPIRIDSNYFSLSSLRSGITIIVLHVALTWIQVLQVWV